MLVKRILTIASRDVMGNWGRIILQDAATILDVTVEEIEKALEELSLEGEVKYKTTNLVLIDRNLLYPKATTPATITWNVDELNHELTDEEIEEHMARFYPLKSTFTKEGQEQAREQIEKNLPKIHQRHFPKPDVEAAPKEIHEYTLAWAEAYEKQKPRRLIIDTILNFLIRNYPLLTTSKRKEIAKTVMAHILDKQFIRSKGT